MYKLSSSDFLNGVGERLVQTIPQIDLLGLIKAYNISQPPAPSAFSRVGISPPVIDDFDDIGSWSSDHNVVNHETARLDSLQKLFNTESFEPRYLRPPPPLLNPSVEEVFIFFGRNYFIIF